MLAYGSKSPTETIATILFRFAGRLDMKLERYIITIAMGK